MPSLIGEKNLLHIIMTNRNVVLRAINNKTNHMFATVSSCRPDLQAKLQERTEAWSPTQRGATKRQKAGVVAKAFADELHRLGMTQLTYERKWQPARLVPPTQTEIPTTKQVRCRARAQSFQGTSLTDAPRPP